MKREKKKFLFQVNRDKEQSTKVAKMAGGIFDSRRFNYVWFFSTQFFNFPRKQENCIII